MDFRDRYKYNTQTDFIAKGGFSRVYKAYDSLINETVAIKVYTAEVSNKYDLIAEIKKGMRLSHPNICRYFNVDILEKETPFGEKESQQVGIMEYMDGGDIKSYLKSHPEDFRKLLLDMLRGIVFLHENGLIHRDIKPQNVLIKNTDRGPVAKITDFGISKLADFSSITMSTNLFGSIEYMSPEQLAPEKYGVNGKLSYNVDLWSFGCLTYELIKGESIYGSEFKNLSTEKVLLKVLEGFDPANFDEIDEPYKTAIQKCLIKDAGQRAQKGNELIKIIELYSSADNIANEQVDEKENATIESETVPINVQDYVQIKETLKTGNEKHEGSDYGSLQEPPKKTNWKKILLLASVVALFSVTALFLAKGYLNNRQKNFSDLLAKRLQDSTKTADSLKVQNYLKAYAQKVQDSLKIADAQRVRDSITQSENQKASEAAAELMNKPQEKYKEPKPKNSGGYSQKKLASQDNTIKAENNNPSNNSYEINFDVVPNTIYDWTLYIDCSAEYAALNHLPGDQMEVRNGEVGMERRVTMPEGEHYIWIDHIRSLNTYFQIDEDAETQYFHFNLTGDTKIKIGLKKVSKKDSFGEIYQVVQPTFSRE